MTDRIHEGPGSSGTTVGLRDPRVVLHFSNVLSITRRPVRADIARGFSAWILRSIILATAGFALLDLFLLVSSVHH
jgi:hypothetical protein